MHFSQMQGFLHPKNQLFQWKSGIRRKIPNVQSVFISSRRMSRTYKVLITYFRPISHESCY